MDFINHAIAGAATGFYFGHPVAGAILAVTPDIVLGVTRKEVPNSLYRVTHSAFILVAVGVIMWLLFGYNSAAFTVSVIGSHLVLDSVTHGKVWGTRLFYPLSEKVLGNFQEWEFFNRSWWFGLLVTSIWSAAWIFAQRLQ